MCNGPPRRAVARLRVYDGNRKLNSRLAVIDRASGKKQSIFELPEKGHVGGLAMSTANLWVASSGTVSPISEVASRGPPAATTARRLQA
jgi:hypothetical protein